MKFHKFAKSHENSQKVTKTPEIVKVGPAYDEFNYRKHISLKISENDRCFHPGRYRKPTRFCSRKNPYHFPVIDGRSPGECCAIKKKRSQNLTLLGKTGSQTKAYILNLLFHTFFRTIGEGV